MKISVAIPDSCLVDEKTLEGKSRKISTIARICAIFRIDEINIYHMASTKNHDKLLLAKILKYLETPQYFRKKLYPKINELKYAGVLYPLKIPSHKPHVNPRKIKSGDIREGIVVNVKGKKFLDVGIKQLIPYFGKETQGKRLTIKFKNGYPNFSVKEISRNEITEYWGYKIKEKGNLLSFLSQWDGNIVLTSRKGKQLTKTHSLWFSKSSKPLLVVFGSPELGLHEILGKNIYQIPNSKILNFFPDQGTETVRLEEAMLGTLSILNLTSSGYL